jgi:cytochrome c5
LIGQRQTRHGSRNTLARLVGVIFAVGFAVTTNAVPSGTSDEIRTRLEPFGSVCRTGDDCGQAAVAAASGSLNAKQVYDKFCFVCHTTGVGGAPKLDDQVAWTERQGKGMDTLWGSLINGIGAMPAKGTCMGCSDDELREVLDYMLAGGE